MSESLNTKFQRWSFNFFPAYRRTGARITYIKADFREVRIKLPLNWTTRNYVGSLFGGSMFAAVDPILMIMFLKNLSRDYLVWVKSGSIQFRKPAYSTLYTTFVIDEAEIQQIREKLEHTEKTVRNYKTELVNEEGIIHAVVEQELYFRKK